jgi:hypothetical protein
LQNVSGTKDGIMSRNNRLLLLGISVLAARPASACEPVVPFMQVMAPTLALSHSLLVLAIAMVLKSTLFAFFERGLPRPRAAWRMFLGNVLTSFIGLLVAVMIASSPVIWLAGVPVVAFLCWLPSRRLVAAAPISWVGRTSAGAIAAIMTSAFVLSCILFVVGQGALNSHERALYWTIKLAAIFLALFASMTLTSVWEEWVIWRLSSRPTGAGFFASVLRTNLYVLLFVMAVPAVLIFPKRLQSPDFFAKRHTTVANPATTRLTRPR